MNQPNDTYPSDPSERLAGVLEAARTIPPAARRAFIEAAVTSDPSLRAELESLLAVADSAESVFAGMADVLKEAMQDPRSGPLLEGLRTGLDGRYVVEREIGRGGMATVFLARDVRHGRSVALKVLHAELGEALGAQRFEREIRMAAGLTHPHILPLLESGKVQVGGASRLWYTMPHVPGNSLRHRLRRRPDGDFAPAWTGLARTLHWWGAGLRQPLADSLLAESEGAARQALRLADTARLVQRIDSLRVHRSNGALVLNCLVCLPDLLAIPAVFEAMRRIDLPNNPARS